MRLFDLALVIAAIGSLGMAVEARNRTNLTAEVAAAPPPAADVAMITCPMRRTPEMSAVMHAAFVGDATLLVEHQARRRARSIREC